MIRNGRAALLCTVFSALLLSSPLRAQPSRTTVEARVGAAAVEWTGCEQAAGCTLVVTGPAGLVIQRQLAAGVTPTLSVFDDAGQRLPDGEYRWEVRPAPRVSAALAKRLAATRRDGQEGAAGQRPLPGSEPSAGALRIVDGSFVSTDEVEPARPGAAAKGATSGPISTKDVVTADDAIIQGSLCVGLDCVVNESFGFDTIRLKENNTRIKFDDTSTSTGFPNHDWQLTANDSASGGANKFSIEDITASTVPFTVTGSAPSNSLFVASSGKVGFGNTTPVLNLHITATDTPAIRQEQTSGGGFTAQTWDIGANEANWFVRDVTFGSRLPLRIRPGAPTSSIDIAASGNVGIGTASPSNSLHVTRSDGTTKVLIKETSATTTPHELLELNNNGGAILILKDTSQTPRWSFGTSGTSFVVDNQANGGVEMSLTSTGNMIISGTLTQNSDRTTKTDIVAVDPRTVLAKLSSLPIATWRKIGESALHLGPMAQDFAATFGLGEDNRHIAPIDLAGVSLAAIQALQAEIRAKDATIDELKTRLTRLEAAVAALSQH